MKSSTKGSAAKDGGEVAGTASGAAASSMDATGKAAGSAEVRRGAMESKVCLRG